MRQLTKLRHWWRGRRNNIEPAARLDRDNDERIAAIIQKVIRRRQANEEVKDQDIVRQHQHLMPRLGRQLGALKGLGTAKEKLEAQSEQIDHAKHHDKEELSWLNSELNGYRLLGRIRYGGQGTVYTATQLSTGRLVALKVLLHQRVASERQRLRFSREIELLGRLQHPNIVTLYDSGTVSDRPFFAMELVEGLQIDEYVELHCENVAQVAGLFLLVCEAVLAAHQRGIIHRDLKPANVVVDGDGRPHLLDFGLGKYADKSRSDDSKSLSMTGQVLGTLPYLSPEQVDGLDDQVDTRTDVYSLGVMLFRLLTEQYPYSIDGSVHASRRNILHQSPMRLRDALAQKADEWRPEAGRDIEDLDSVIRRALEKDKQDRYQSVADLAIDLRRYLDNEPVLARAHSGLYVLRKTLRRYKFQLGLAATFLVIVGALASSAFWYAMREQAARATGELRQSLGHDANLYTINLLATAHADANRLREIKRLPRELVSIHLARYRLPSIAPGKHFAPFTPDMPLRMIAFLQSPSQDEAIEVQQWLASVESALDDIAAVLDEQSVRFPLARNVGLLLGITEEGLEPALRCCDAFIVRAHTRFANGDDVGAVNDLTAARRLALDIGDTVSSTHALISISRRNHLYVVVQRALTEVWGDRDRMSPYVDWLIADPAVVSHRAALVYRHRGLSEVMQGLLMATPDGRGGIDLERLDDLLGGRLQQLGALSPVHRDFCQTMQPTEVSELLDRFLGSVLDWEDHTYAQVSRDNQLRLQALEAERAHNPLALMIGSEGQGGLNRLRCCALGRALRIVAFLAQYQLQHAAWPERTVLAVPEECRRNLVDPITGSPFIVELRGTMPFIRSAPLDALSDGAATLAKASKQVLWAVPDEDRITYFPARQN